MEQEEPPKPQAPRGRKRKIVTPLVVSAVDEPVQNVHIVVEELTPPSPDAAAAAAAKKRGRKPKGGKLILKLIDPSPVTTSMVNVILHLKCSLVELEDYIVQQNKQINDPLHYNPEIPPEIVGFDRNPNTFASFESTTTTSESPTTTTTTTTQESPSVETNSLSADHIQKIKKLKVNIYKSAIQNNKSACFWCTYDFDNDACFIPQTMDATMIHAYGSFCRPECAVGYLMNENLDDSTKFERYHLLNHVYGSILGYKSNIKPAPNPHYILDKFYGNMTIQEYRKLLNSDHLLYTMDKPMTRILPELHEVTDEFVLNIYGGNSNTNKGATQAGGVYKVKRQSEKQQGPSKASIIRGKFGMTQ
jgi:hypothetical protein